MTVLDAASFRVTGLPAVLIILAVLTVLITGIVVIIRAVGRKAKNVGQD